MSSATIIDKPAAPSWSTELCLSELQQQEHYDNIAAEYEEHYSDEYSVEYRRRFIYEPMFAELELEGKKVLDAMCGSGQTTEYLLKRGAKVTGLDISNEVIEKFKTRWTNVTALQRSLLDSGLANNSFDYVVIVGGLHHIHPNVNRAVQEIHRVLRPGGHLCFMEPHAGSLPDLVRRLWYKVDRFFSDNEEAIDVEGLKRDFQSQFTLTQAKYLGNLAFLLVLNSLIFRLPARTKKYYSPVMMKLESMISKLQGKLTSCFVVTQWEKK
jgi:SAM-dependent methyltransferase